MDDPTIRTFKAEQARLITTLNDCQLHLTRYRGKIDKNNAGLQAVGLKRSRRKHLLWQNHGASKSIRILTAEAARAHALLVQCEDLLDLHMSETYGTPRGARARKTARAVPYSDKNPVRWANLQLNSLPTTINVQGGSGASAVAGPPSTVPSQPSQQTTPTSSRSTEIQTSPIMAEMGTEEMDSGDATTVKFPRANVLTVAITVYGDAESSAEPDSAPLVKPEWPGPDLPSRPLLQRADTFSSFEAWRKWMGRQ